MAKQSAIEAIVRGLRWWRSELIGLLPVAERRAARRRPDILLLEVSRSRISALRCTNGNRDELATVALPDAERRSGASLSSVGDLIALDGAIDPKITPVVVRVSPDEVLSRVVTLPPAAAENLRAVLTFEMHRQTPFTADQVYFDYRVLESNPGDAHLRVELSVTRRDLVDAAIGLLPPWDLRVSGADEAREIADDGLALRLAPSGPAASSYRTVGKLLWATNAALLVAVLAIPLVRQASHIEQLRERVAAAKTEAESAAVIRQRAERAQADRRFLIGGKRTRPALVSVLAELTASIPDSTWVQRLEIKSRKVRMRGTSTAASSLIPIIEDIPLFRRVTFNAPVTSNPGTGKEQFQLVFEIAPSGDADEDANGQDIQKSAGAIAAAGGLVLRR